jgi:putative hydrolase of HD superfamily
MKSRLKKQIEFIIEIDKIKKILRKTRLFDSSKNENVAEHSWHISLMAIILQEYSNQPIDILKVVKMLLIHDIVEIDVGDIFLYHPNRHKNKYELEKRAAERIFGILPENQRVEFINLWNEFELKKSAEAKYAHVLDRLEPLLQNYLTKGISWQEFNIKYEQVIKANQHIEYGSKKLWDYAKTLIHDSVEKDYLKKK